VTGEQRASARAVTGASNLAFQAGETVSINSAVVRTFRSAMCAGLKACTTSQSNALYRVGVDEGGTIPFIRRYVIMLP